MTQALFDFINQTVRQSQQVASLRTLQPELERRACFELLCGEILRAFVRHPGLQRVTLRVGVPEPERQCSQGLNPFTIQDVRVVVSRACSLEPEGATPPEWQGEGLGDFLYAHLPLRWLGAGSYCFERFVSPLQPLLDLLDPASESSDPNALGAGLRALASHVDAAFGHLHWASSLQPALEPHA